MPVNWTALELKDSTWLIWKSWQEMW
jgi:hypothetical protein